jgi:hypothetical protein
MIPLLNDDGVGVFGFGENDYCNYCNYCNSYSLAMTT